MSGSAGYGNRGGSGYSNGGSYSQTVTYSHGGQSVSLPVSGQQTNPLVNSFIQNRVGSGTGPDRATGVSNALNKSMQP